MPDKKIPDCDSPSHDGIAQPNEKAATYVFILDDTEDVLLHRCNSCLAFGIKQDWYTRAEISSLQKIWFF